MKKTRALFVLLAVLGMVLAAPIASFAQDASPAPAASAAPAASPSPAVLGKFDASGVADEQVKTNLQTAAAFGNNAWLIAATALVFFMTVPGLALFYGGLVRKKNVLSVMMQSLASMAIVSVVWVTIGFSLAFSDQELIPGLVGNLNFSFMFDQTTHEYLGGVNNLFYVSQAGSPINTLVFVMFQCMFAVITPALIIGAYAERFKFPHFVAFTVFWIIFVYAPIAHSVWNANGWLFKLGALDFAGGSVVHINAGIAGLVAALVLGKRAAKKANPPHNLVFTVVGAAMLWFGWFGFNAGSGLAADGVAGSAFMVTNTATAIAAITWFVLDWIFHRKPTVLGASTGAVAGLVAITPAAGFVSLAGAVAIGIAVSLVCYFFVVWVKGKLKYDDALDCFGVHGIGGIIGALFTGLFADPAVWQAVGGSYTGVFYGNPGQFVIQLADIGFSIAWSGIGTFIIIGILRLLGARASEREQAVGLDIVEHNERAYTVIE